MIAVSGSVARFARMNHRALAIDAIGDRRRLLLWFPAGAIALAKADRAGFVITHLSKER
jgi:hypothetical protein